MTLHGPAGPKTAFHAAVAVLIGVFVATGCYTSHVRTPCVDANEVQLTRAVETDSSFAYEKGMVPFTNHLQAAGANSLYEHRFLEIPSVGDNNQPDNLITASYYRSIVPGSHPMVLVLPIWGTYTYPSRKTAAYIQRHAEGQAHVLHVHGENYLVDWDGLDAAPDGESFLELWREAIERQRVTVIDFRRLVDWAEQRPEIDAGRVGIVGFSFAA